MSRPVTMFTGQWADLPLEELAKNVKSFGYDRRQSWPLLGRPFSGRSWPCPSQDYRACRLPRCWRGTSSNASGRSAIILPARQFWT